MLRTVFVPLLLFPVLLASVSTPVGAQPSPPPNACAAAKVEASGAMIGAVLDCYGKVSDRNGAPDARCLGRAVDRLQGAFAAIERRGSCDTTGDSTVVGQRLLTLAANLSLMVNAPRPTQCAKHVFDAMAVNASEQYACRASALLRGAGYSVDSACQDEASDAFFVAFDRASRKHDCGAVPSDAAAIDARLRQAAAGTSSVIKPPMTSCAPVEVTVLHGTNFSTNSRLSKIEDGQVACMHADDGTIASCAFLTTPVASGEWLESPDGLFARVGQSIALDGRPGGDYVIAARVSDGQPAACVDGAGLDTLGRVAEGTQLANICTVESLLSDYNALAAEWGWTPMSNYADREVCSSNNPATSPHPDGATLVRSYSSTGSGPADTFCYTGIGAALNDLNGAERDWLGGYYGGEQFCHYVHASGVEVPAAKRPATFSLPAPGGINTRSKILWRPVNPNVVIANGGPVPPLQTFNNLDGFQQTTHARSNGPMPDLGAVGTSVTIGSITFSLAAGGDSLAVGTLGTPAAPDWYPDLPGNDIALGYENLQLQFATPVYSFGFEFVEPNATMPAFGGNPGDSTFEIVLYRGAAEVGRMTFNANDDEVGFVGVWSRALFDRVTIFDLSGNDDDEYFGRFYAGTSPPPF